MLSSNRKRLKTTCGFTLAELLVSLAILGVIATFTIPKILSTQQNGSFNAKAKEAVAMVSGAYQAYQMNNQVTDLTGIRDITPYMNYLRTDSTSTIDLYQTNSTLACNAYSGTCLVLHNGARLKFYSNDYFNGNTTLNGIPFEFDPDGQVTDGTTNGPGKSIRFFIYRNGKIRDLETVEPGTNYNNGGGVLIWNPTLGTTPPWFNWN